MIVFIAEVGDAYEPAWYTEIFADKATAYRAALDARNNRMQEDRRIILAHKGLRPNSGYFDYLMRVTVKKVIGT